MLKRSPWPVIMQIVPELSTGGAERTTIEIAEAVTLAGGMALVLSRGGMLEDELKAVGGHLIRFPASTKNPAHLILNGFRIGRLMSRRGVSLVHARSRAPAWSAYLAARQQRRAFVTTYHGIYNQEGRSKALYNSVMARGHAVICNSFYTAETVRQRHPEAEARIEVIHRGVDVAKFDPSAVSDDRVHALRRAWGVSSQSRIVLLPGRLTRWKGQETLIRAASGLKTALEQRDVLCVMVGDDQGRSGYRQELDRLITELGVRDKVIIAGHCSDMPAAFAAAMLTVIPSIEPEAFGRVSVEAQAMACPVVVSNIGALPETILSEIPASADQTANASGSGEWMPSYPVLQPWIVEPGNATALGESIMTVSSMPRETLDRVGALARQHAIVNFSKTTLQAKTLGVYDRILGTQLGEAFKRLTAL